MTHIRRLLTRIRIRPSQFCASALLFVVVGVFLVVQPASAVPDIGSTVRDIIGSILQFFISTIGSVLFLAMKALIKIAQYNNFVSSETVQLGWAIVRDLTNMFFVLVMLIVAFATIFGIGNYSYQAVLPRLFLMAVLINFSKVVVGLLIDFSQVVMMTFVNGFAAAAGGNLVNLLKIQDLVTFSPSAETLGQWEIVGAMFLAVVMLGLALAAVVLFIIMLVARIVMLWILTILSPLAFFLSAVPFGQAKNMYTKWTGMLGNYLVAGPVLAFFLWLSFAAAGSGDIATREGFAEDYKPPAGERGGEIASKAGVPINFVSYVIGLALLMGGMTIASQFGTIGGSGLAGAASWVQNKGANFMKRAARAPLDITAATAKGAWKGTKAAAGIGALALAAKTGVDLRPATWKKTAGDMMKATKDRYEKEAVDSAARRGRVFSSPAALQSLWAKGGLKAVGQAVNAKMFPGAAVAADAESKRSEEQRLRDAQSRVTTKDERDAQLANVEGRRNVAATNLAELTDPGVGLAMTKLTNEERTRLDASRSGKQAEKAQVDQDLARATAAGDTDRAKQFTQQSQDLGKEITELDAMRASGVIKFDPKVEFTRSIKDELQKKLDSADTEITSLKDASVTPTAEYAADVPRMKQELGKQADAAGARAGELEGAARKRQAPSVPLYEKRMRERVGQVKEDFDDYNMDPGDLHRRYQGFRTDKNEAGMRAVMQQYAKQGQVSDFLKLENLPEGAEGLQESLDRDFVRGVGTDKESTARFGHEISQRTEEVQYKGAYAANPRTGEFDIQKFEKVLEAQFKKLSTMGVRDVMKQSTGAYVSGGAPTALGVAAIDRLSKNLKTVKKAVVDGAVSSKFAKGIVDAKAKIELEWGTDGKELVKEMENVLAQKSTNMDDFVERANKMKGTT